MRVLIVGCGYLGERAAELFLAQAASVSALTRSPERVLELERLGIRAVRGDVLDIGSLESLPAADLCLYAVGYDRRQSASKEEVYVAGLQNVLAALRQRCPRLIYISSSSVYGQGAGEVVDEDSPCQPTSEGGRICLEAEQVLRDTAMQSNNLSAVILRLSGIYGPGRLLARTEQLKSGLTLSGNPQAFLNLIHVGDAARAVVAISQKFPTQAMRMWLLSDAQPVRRAEFYAHLANRVGGPPPTFLNDSPGLNKRCDSTRIRTDLPLTLEYHSFVEGLDDALRPKADK